MEITSDEHALYELKAIRQYLQGRDPIRPLRSMVLRLTPYLKQPSRPEESILAERARELIKAKFSKATSSKLIREMSWLGDSTKPRGSPRKREPTEDTDKENIQRNFLAALDSAIAMLELQCRQKLNDPEAQPYLASLVSHAMWSSKMVRGMALGLATILAIALGLLGIGFYNFNTKIVEADKLVQQANQELEKARLNMASTRELNESTQVRIDAFRKTLVDKEDDLQRITARVRQLENEANARVTEFDSHVINLTKTLGMSFNRAKIEFDEMPQEMRRIAKEKTESAMTDFTQQKGNYMERLKTAETDIFKLEQNISIKNNSAELADTKLTALSQEITNLQTKLDETARAAGAGFNSYANSKKEDLRIEVEKTNSEFKTALGDFVTTTEKAANDVKRSLSSRSTTLENEIVTPIRQKAAEIGETQARLSAAFAAQLASLEVTAAKIKSLQTEINTRSGSIDLIVDGMTRTETKISDAYKEIARLNGEIKPLATLIQGLHDRGSPIEDYVAKAVAVSNKSIAARIQYVSETNTWLIILAGSIIVVALTLAIWSFRLSRQIRRLDSSLPPSSGG